MLINIDNVAILNDVLIYELYKYGYFLDVHFGDNELEEIRKYLERRESTIPLNVILEGIVFLTKDEIIAEDYDMYKELKDIFIEDNVVLEEYIDSLSERFEKITYNDDLDMYMIII